MHQLTIQTQSDVVALLPFALGFPPQDSVVILGLGPSGETGAARMDMPQSDEEATSMVIEVIAGFLRGKPTISQAIIVVVTDEDPLFRPLALLAPFLVSPITVESMFVVSNALETGDVTIDLMELSALSGVPHASRAAAAKAGLDMTGGL